MVCTFFIILKGKVSKCVYRSAFAISIIFARLNTSDGAESRRVLKARSAWIRLCSV